MQATSQKEKKEMSRFRLATTALAAMLLAVPSLADDAVTPHYINVPGTDTKLKVYGFVQVYGEYYANQNEFDNGTIIDGFSSHTNAVVTPTQQFQMTPRTSRFGFATITPSASYGDITTKVEVDFAQASQQVQLFTTTGAVAANGFSAWLTQNQNGAIRLRQAVIGIGNFTVGYTWSNWIDLDAGAETVDWGGPVGQAPGDTPRYTQIRYTFPIDKNNSLAFSLEENMNQEGQFYAGSPAGLNAASTVPDCKFPTVVAAYTYSDKWGHIALRGLEQYWGGYTAPTVPNSTGIHTSSWAAAGQVSGAINIGKDALVASVYTGKGLGAYGMDNGYDAEIDTAANTVNFTTSTGWQAGYTHVWNSTVRSNIVAGGVSYSNDPDNVPTISPANGDVKTVEDAFINTFVKFSKSCELGIEYGYETVKTFGSLAVTDSNNNLTNKLSESKVQVSLTANF
jgi:hypothetical protein